MFKPKSKSLVVCSWAFILGLMSTSCVGPAPQEEQYFAYAALKLAKEAGAESLSSGLYFQAENAYNKAVRDLKEKSHDKARIGFQSAQDFAERAENLTRVKKFQSGEVFE